MAKKRIMAVRRGMWLISLLAVLSLVAACAKAAPTSTTSQAPKPTTTAATSTTSQAPKPSTTTTTAVKPTEWTFLSPVVATDWISGWAKEYAAEVKQRTGGRLNITVRFPGEFPYKQADFLRATRDGEAQMSNAVPIFVGGDAPLMLLMDLASWAGYPQEKYDIIDKTARPLINAELEKNWNATIFSSVQVYPAQIFAKKPMTTLNDLKGLKIRVRGADDGEILKGIGAVPSFIAVAEVPTALDRGVIDGQVAALEKGLQDKSWEVTPYLYFLDFARAHTMFIVNLRALRALPADVQKIVLDTGAYFDAKWLKEYRERQGKVWDDLKPKMKMVGQATDKERTLVTKAAEAAIQEWLKKAGPQGQTALTAIRKALGE